VAHDHLVASRHAGIRKAVLGLGAAQEQHLIPDADLDRHEIAALPDAWWRRSKSRLRDKGQVNRSRTANLYTDSQ
jgi:hypothetical protein